MAKILLRRGSSEEWALVNPVLFEGELGVDLTTRAVKMGNGVTQWTDLPVLIGGDGGAPEDVETYVDSVNGLTGDVVITLTDLGGAPLGHTHTPESIGAATAGHTHSAAEIGAAAVSHTHTAEQVGAIPVGDVTAIEVVTQAEYDGLITKNPSTLYVISET